MSEITVFSMFLPHHPWNDLPTPLTMPAVTEGCNPLGLDTASTSCPSLSFSESPNGNGSRVGASTFKTATSVNGSRPTTLASKDLPS